MSSEDEYFEKLEWMAQGVERGWADPAVCSTHDTWLTDKEFDLFDEGADPCVLVMRVYD
tara:strand:+ start:5785 stop:5961 length:177 start_codon:yes stop_codon:yes gene_type:complete